MLSFLFFFVGKLADTGLEHSTMTDEPGVAAASGMMMLPWFLDGPWVPRYEGKRNSILLSEWHNQMELYLWAQTLTAAQRVDFVMSALQGDARYR